LPHPDKCKGREAGRREETNRMKEEKEEREETCTASSTGP
jgi:hypothetical protein